MINEIRNQKKYKLVNGEYVILSDFEVNYIAGILPDVGRGILTNYRFVFVKPFRFASTFFGIPGALLSSAYYGNVIYCQILFDDLVCVDKFKHGLGSGYVFKIKDGTNYKYIFNNKHLVDFQKANINLPK